MPARVPFQRTSQWLACVATLPLGLFGMIHDAGATFYQVNSPADVPDASTATAACETAAGNGVCTLRAAVQQANAHAGLDTILVPAGTYVLSRVGVVDGTAFNGDLDLTDDVTIIGAGAASTIIDGNGAVTQDRVFELMGSITVTLSGMTIRNGISAYNGGGIASVSNLTIDNCIVSGNSVIAAPGSPAQGGGIDSSGALAVKNSVIANNSITLNGAISGVGGGIQSAAPLTISNSTLSGNVAGGGGGLHAETQVDVVVTNSTFSGNSALLGGAIYSGGATTSLINDTISGNSSDFHGGGILSVNGVLALFSTTVAGNVANADKTGGGVGGGIYNSGASATLDNSILSGNSYRVDGSQLIVLADCAGTYASSGNNIVTHPTCTINGAYSTAAPMLGPLQDNGGPTLTHALLPGSPAVDAGGACFDKVGAPLGIDQRGVPRPQGAACDLGAFELEDLIFADAFETSA